MDLDFAFFSYRVFYHYFILLEDFRQRHPRLLACSISGAVRCPGPYWHWKELFLFSYWDYNVSFRVVWYCGWIFFWSFVKIRLFFDFLQLFSSFSFLGYLSWLVFELVSSSNLGWLHFHCPGEIARLQSPWRDLKVECWSLLSLLADDFTNVFRSQIEHCVILNH